MKLTPEIENSIEQFIRAGGWDWIAAEAAGVPFATFINWMDRGRKSGRQPFRRFFLRVHQAAAQGRLKAEIDCYRKDPKNWLRFGPGRQRKGRPGWLYPGHNTTGRPNPETNLLTTKEWKEIWKVIQDALADQPAVKMLIAERFALLAENSRSAKKGKGKCSP